MVETDSLFFKRGAEMIAPSALRSWWVAPSQAASSVGRRPCLRTTTRSPPLNQALKNRRPRIVAMSRHFEKITQSIKRLKPLIYMKTQSWQHSCKDKATGHAGTVSLKGTTMSLKEFSVRCSAITQTTAHAYGIVRAMGPRRPAAHTRSASRSHRQERGHRVPTSIALAYKPA